MSGDALHLVGVDHPAPFRGQWNDMDYWQAFRRSGVLAEITPSELKVLVYAIAHVTRRRGDHACCVDLPVRTIADAAGFQRKSIQRGIKGLLDKGLLEHVGGSSIDHRINRYLIALPDPRPGAALSPAPGSAPGIAPGSSQQADPDTPRAGETQHAIGPGRDRDRGHLCPGRGTSVSRKGDTRVAQSTWERKEESSKQPAPEVRSESEGPSLFDDPPGFDAAAALSLRRLGMTASTAAGLVNHHGLSRVQVRNVLANLRFARRRKVAVHNPVGWVISAIRKGQTEPEQPVLDVLYQRRVRRAKRHKRAELDRQAEREALVRHQAAARRDQAEQAFDALPATERRRLMDAQRPDLAAGPITVPTPDSRLRAWAIDAMAEQQAKENQ